MGTGTRTPCSSTPGGALAAICAAIRSATASVPRNFSSRTSARAAPSWAIGAHARVNAARRAGQAPHGRGSAQRGHVSGPSHGSSARQRAQRSRPARPSGARHARHAGGTRSESRRSSTPDTLPDELCRRHTALPRLCAAIATIPPMPLAGASPDASWNLEPGALVLVVIVGYAYLRRWRAVRAEAGTLALSGWRAAAFLAGLGCVLVALVSPVDRLAEQILPMHM